MDLKHKQTIQKALMGGVNAARKHTEELRRELMDATFDSPQYKTLEAQIDDMDSWVVELGDALHWLGGAELAQISTLTLLPLRSKGGE